jgi:molybdenum cofactor cytidylyltransferase
VRRFALILAAGASRRLGQPKQLVEIDGVPLVARAVSVARGAGLEPLVLVGSRAEDVRTVLASDVETLLNPDWERGIGATIRAGVHHVQNRASCALVLPCDLPRLTADDVRLLLEAFETSAEPAAASVYDGIVGVPAIFDASVFDRLLALPDGRGASGLLRSGSLDCVPVPMPNAAFDLDTPEDLEALR